MARFVKPPSQTHCPFVKLRKFLVSFQPTGSALDNEKIAVWRCNKKVRRILCTLVGAEGRWTEAMEPE